MGNPARDKGHRAERKYARIFRDLGYEDCQTSRYESKALDDVGIDLTNLPFNVQIKAGYARGLNISSVLKKIKENLKTKFKNRAKNPTIVIHEKDSKKGIKRDETHTLVCMTFEDFKKLIKK